MFAAPVAPPAPTSVTWSAQTVRNSAATQPVTPVTDPAPMPAPVTTLPPFGPDVSVWKGSVNWPLVVSPQIRDGQPGRTVSFAFTKATERTWVDPTLATNWRGMASVGLIRGAYDFAAFSRNPRLDARFYVATMNSVGGFRAKGDFAVLDSEGPTMMRKTKVIRWITAWTREVHRLTGLPNSRIVIYTGGWWWGPHTGNSTVFARAGHPLWLSGYRTKPSLPGWQTSWWQYTDRAKFPGIKGGTDASVWLGTEQSLRRLAGY